MFIIFRSRKGDIIRAPADTIAAFVKHIHPRRIPLEALSINRTWGLGGACLVLLGLLAGSGALMLFSYQPAPDLAYASVQKIESNYLFGRMIRSIHYFSANILAVAIFLHMLRVFFTGAFSGVRRMNWLIGLCPFFLVLLSSFTGYLLPWDQTAYWAVTICINMMEYVPFRDLLRQILFSGNTVSADTLQLFFTFHTTIIPICFVVFLLVHFWKIRKAKGVILPTAEPVMADAYPNLFLREAVTALVLLALVLTLATFFPAPLGEMANAGVSPNPAKAPWYFSGFQELLLHFHPVFAVFVIPLIVFLLITVLPFYKKWASDHPGVWLISSRARKNALGAALASLIFIPALIIANEYVLDFQKIFSGMTDVISTGLIPFSAVMLSLAGYYFWAKKAGHFSDAEAFQTILVFLVVTYVVMAFFTTFLRGSGMELIFSGGGG